MKANLYLKVKKINGWDDCYIPLKEDKTWKTILSHVDYILDVKYLDNDEKLKGIN